MESTRSAIKAKQTAAVSLCESSAWCPPNNQPAKQIWQGKVNMPTLPSSPRNRDHILRCQHPSWDEWRQTFLHAISEHCSCDTNAYPPIMLLLTSIMQRWSRGEYNPQVGTDQFPPDMSSTIRQQSQIGWRQLFYWRFAQARSDTQHSNTTKGGFQLNNSNLEVASGNNCEDMGRVI